MLRRALLAAVLLANGGCVTSGPPVSAGLSQSAILSTDGLPDLSLARTPPSAEAIFALDDEMRAFVADQLRRAANPEVRLRRLLAGMEARGLSSVDYEANVTKTAAETFRDRRGNCLSFTILFVALAREAGLRARYQMVDIPPSWSSESDLVLLSSHINALVDTQSMHDFVVDFNLLELKGNYRTRIVNDRYALALFYNNVGVDALIEGDYPTSFLHFKAAIETFPELSGAWVNVGLLFAKLGRHEQAKSAYLRAIQVDPSNRSALTNLANLYASIGDDERARLYRERVRRHQLRNPYYHYALAQRAYREGRFVATIDSIAPAIRLKRDEHQFYFLQALAYHRLGEQRKAEASLARAKEHAGEARIEALYESELEALNPL